MKSPLKDVLEYCAAPALKRIIPEDSVVDSYMLYAGTLELPLARSGRKIIAHTTKYPVYEFWKIAKEEPLAVSAAVKEFYPKIDSQLFYFLQQSWAEMGDPLARAAFFFLLNRCSAAGCASSGKIDKEEFSVPALNYLRNFKGENFYPQWDAVEDPVETLEQATEGNYFIIPAGRFNYNLFDYGKNRGHDMTLLNHQRLYEKMKSIDKKGAVVYKNSSKVEELYSSFNLRFVDERGRFTDKRKDAKEIIIVNF